MEMSTSSQPGPEAGVEWVRERMPSVGFGTYLIKDEADIRAAVEVALECGFRFFDTAQIYRNEEFVGRALRDFLPRFQLQRADVFVTSKLNPKWNGREAYEKVRESVQKMGLDYVDLFLIHWPGRSGWNVADKRNPEARRAAWQGLERAYNEGLVKAIGISNFEPRHLEELRSYWTVRPAVNQCEFHPAFCRPAVVEATRSLGIHFQAYSSFGGSDNDSLLSHAPFVQLAAKHECTVAQLLLAWALSQDIRQVPDVLPKSLNADHIRANFAAQKLRVTSEEVEAMKWKTEKKFCWDPKNVA